MRSARLLIGVVAAVLIIYTVLALIFNGVGL